VRAERRHLRLSRGHGVASARRGHARVRGRGAHVANEHAAALGRLVVVAFPFCRSSVHVDGWLVLEPRVTRRLRSGRGHITRSRERRRRHAPGVLCLVPGVSASLRWGEREPRVYKKLTRRLLRHEIRTSAEFRKRFDFVARFCSALFFSSGHGLTDGDAGRFPSTRARPLSRAARNQPRSSREARRGDAPASVR
jgi:hypothetical protein